MRVRVVKEHLCCDAHRWFFWGQHCCCTEASIIGKDFFVFISFSCPQLLYCPRPTTVLASLNLLIAYLKTIFLFKLAYLCDIFATLNKLIISVQGSDKNMLDASDEIAVFIKKLSLWKEDIANVSKGSHCFTFLSNLLEKILCLQKKEDYIYLTCNNLPKRKFNSKNPSNFLISLNDKYLSFAKKCHGWLSLCRIYLCKATFSAMALIKTKYQSQSYLEGKRCVSFTNIFKFQQAL